MGKILGEALVALLQGGCVVVFGHGDRITGGQLAALVFPCLACCRHRRRVRGDDDGPGLIFDYRERTRWRSAECSNAVRGRLSVSMTKVVISTVRRIA
jgi:hypothetical protein